MIRARTARAGCLALLLAAALPLGGCLSLGPVWSPHVDGRVVDGRGEPVPGATVWIEHPVGIVMSHGGNAHVGRRSTTTDADGRFSFRGRLVVAFLPGAITDPIPDVFADHVLHGSAGLYFYPNSHERCCRDLVLRLGCQDADADRRVDAENVDALCHRERNCRARVQELYPEAPLEGAAGSEWR